MEKFDVVALGEILIDMTYAGKSEQGHTLFEQNPGGAPANVLTAVQRLGGKTALIGKIGDDMHGEFLRQTVEKEGICAKNLITDNSVFTTLAFVNLDENGNRSFSFARKPGADTCLTPEEVDLSLLESTKIFHFGSLSLTDEPAKSATFFTLEKAKEMKKIISYDPNYRAPLWESEEKAISGMRSVLDYVDIIKISDEETNLLTSFKEVEKASEELLNKGIKIVIVTMGKDGAHIRTKDGFIVSPALPVKAVDTTGAGDSFMGGFLYQISKSEKDIEDLTLSDIKDFADFSNKVSGYCVQRRGAINAMPHLNEI